LSRYFLIVGVLALSFTAAASVAQTWSNPDSPAGIESSTKTAPVMRNTISTSVDCTEVTVQYSDDKSLTQQERLEAMDQALFESLNKFDLCQSAAKGNSGAGSASGGGGMSGSGTEGGAQEQNASADGSNGDGNGPGDTGKGEATHQSIASSGLSGTETPATTEATGNLDSPSQTTSLPPSETGSDGDITQNPQVLGGETPDDIPPADNDDALAAQIRYAAENEPDPEKKARLWDEYRKYKGLPQSNGKSQ
jgi:hypothetical protein